MNIDNLVFKTSIPIDKASLLQEFQDLQQRFPEGQSYKYTAGQSQGQDSKKVPILWVYNLKDLNDFKNKKLTEQVSDLLTRLQIDETPVFTFLAIKQNCTLGWHVDDAFCSFNLLLTPSEAPITFEGGHSHYSEALIDVSHRHKVENTGPQRVIFRISFQKHKFPEVLGRWQNLTEH